MNDAHPPADLRQLKSTALVVFLTGIAFNAIVAIMVIMGGVGSDVDWQILATSLLLTGASIGVIANAAGHERGAVGYAPHLAGLSLLVGIGMSIFAVWEHVHAEEFYEWLGTFLVAGVTGTYVSLISLPRMRQEYAWLQWSAYGLAATTGGLGIVAIRDFDAVSAELFGVLGVLLAAATVVVPVLARAQRPATPADIVADNPATWVAFCPVCGAGLPPSTATVQACPRCTSRFRVEVLDATSA